MARQLLLLRTTGTMLYAACAWWAAFGHPPGGIQAKIRRIPLVDLQHDVLEIRPFV